MSEIKADHYIGANKAILTKTKNYWCYLLYINETPTKKKQMNCSSLIKIVFKNLQLFFASYFLFLIFSPLMCI